MASLAHALATFPDFMPLEDGRQTCAVRAVGSGVMRRRASDWLLRLLLLFLLSLSVDFLLSLLTRGTGTFTVSVLATISPVGLLWLLVNTLSCVNVDTLPEACLSSFLCLKLAMSAVSTEFRYSSGTIAWSLSLLLLEFLKKLNLRFGALLALLFGISSECTLYLLLIFLMIFFI